VTGVVIEGHDALVAQPEMTDDGGTALGVLHLELAEGAVDDAEPRAQLARALAEAARGRLQPHAVVLARVGGVVEHAVHPLAGVGVEAREGDEIDLRGCDAALAQEGVDGPTRIAGVVLEPREALFGGAADDDAVLEDRRRRAVRLRDPEHDHATNLTNEVRAG
jgi:hypothetical protein